VTNRASADTKESLRRKFRAVLASLDASMRAALSEQLAARLAEFLNRSGVAELAIFAAMDGEPDLSGLHRLCPGIRFHYPRCRSAGLDFHFIADPGSLQPGRFGLREPAPHHPLRNPGLLDAILCPGLAFSSAGVRLGRGGGYYDRCLATARDGLLRIGVGFALQHSHNLPREPHDILMTHLATEEGVVRCGSVARDAARERSPEPE